MSNVTTPGTMKVQFQSNSIRDNFLRDIMDRTINEILASVSSLLGPGATDAFIIKENQAYYTRDGKEVCESLIFDNEVANYVHHILYQAVYNQGRNAGDGSTTLAVLYCEIYRLLREASDRYEGITDVSINDARRLWKTTVDRVIEKLKERSVPLDEDLLLSMLYTCTQDAELAAKIYHELKDPILSGAYILPRKSNINTDFNVTVHNRPVFKVTNHFSIKPLQAESEFNVIYFCNGYIDIAHSELIAAMSCAGIRDPYKPNTDSMIFPNIYILGTGVTEATRKSIREYNQFMRNAKVDTSAMCNVCFLTLDDYRAMTMEEIEDIATVITGVPGLGGIVQPLTFESYLYRAFLTPAAQENLHLEPIPELESFDTDQSLVQDMMLMFAQPYRVLYDEVNGIAIDRELTGYAELRYKELRKQIEEEKSPVKKLDLNKRLRRSFGMFIDLEVGSVLLKDSQRKFELILDAIISTAEAAKDGVLIGNSMIHAASILADEKFENAVSRVILDALGRTVNRLIKNAYPNSSWEDETLIDNLADNDRKPEDFNILNVGDYIWPPTKEVEAPEIIKATFQDKDGSTVTYEINPRIVESYNAIKAILENSALPMELAKTRQITLSGRQGLMGNYVD